MSTDEAKLKRRVWLGGLAALVGVVAWTWWGTSRLELPAGVAPRSQPFVQLAGVSSATGSRILQERSELQDPTPLFFPTEWNYGQRPLNPVVLRQPGEVFGSFQPKLTATDQTIASYGEETATAPEKLSDVLVQGNEAPFAGLGQVDRPLSTLPARSGYLEVSDLKNGQYVVSQSLAGLQAPRLDFAPLEFMVVVGRAGLIGPPLLTSGSGWDEVDTFFRNYLITSYHLGERLPPGRYRVRVGT